jgi:hypothetical protein
VGSGALVKSRSPPKSVRQLQAKKELEDHKGAIINQLDYKRNDLALSLDTHRNSLAGALEEKKSELAGQLDRQRHELGLDIAMRRLQIDTLLAQLGALSNAAVAYRYEVGTLRRGEFEEDEASAKAKDLDLAMDSMDSFTGDEPLRRALESFRQRGTYLIERAGRISTSDGQRNLWREISKAPVDNGEPLGPLFGADSKTVRDLLSAARTQIMASR